MVARVTGIAQPVESALRTERPAARGAGKNARHAPAAPSEGTGAQAPAAGGPPSAQAGSWAALQAHATDAVRFLERLGAQLASLADRPGASAAPDGTHVDGAAPAAQAGSPTPEAVTAALRGGRPLPGPMTIEGGQVVNRAGHAPGGLNRPAPETAAAAAPAGERAADPESTRRNPDFPWPGWPRAPLPRSRSDLRPVAPTPAIPA